MLVRSTGFRMRVLCRQLLAYLSVSVALVFSAAAAQPALAQTATTTTLAITSGGSAATAVSAGTVVTLTATVKAGSTPVAPGQVKFCDATAKYCEDFHIVGAAQLTSSGTAVIKFRPTLGSHSYKAVFVGTRTYAASTSAASSLTGSGPVSTMTSVTYRPSTLNTSPVPPAVLITSVLGNGLSPNPTGTLSLLNSSNGNAVLASTNLNSSSPYSGWAFWNTATFTVPNGSQVLAVADFNRDGIPDLAISSTTANVVTIYLGHADGTFTAAANPITSLTSPGSISVGDFNSDGIPDLAISTGSDVAIFIGSGDGTFTAGATYSFSLSTPAVIADYNNDGIPDLAFVAGSGTATALEVLLGKGDGTFTAQATGPDISGVSGPFSLAAADFNGKGATDLALVWSNGGGVYLGNGDGTFPATTTHPVELGGAPFNVFVADYNDDGIPDLVYNVGTSDTQYGELGDNLVILVATGTGGFNPASSFFSAPIIFVGAGDFNGDGIPDLVVYYLVDGALEYGSLYYGNGDGTFTQSTIGLSYIPGLVSVPTNITSSSVTADFNGDGITDLATVYPPASASAPTQAAVDLSLWDYYSWIVDTNTGAGFPYGDYSVQSTYSGDSHYAASVSPILPIDNQVQTNLNLTMSPGSGLTAGQQVTFTATLAPDTYQGTNTNGEIISFNVNSNAVPGGVLATAALSNGVATATIPIPGKGSELIWAAYGGDTYLGAVNSNFLTPNVAAVPTALALSASSSSGNQGQSVTLTAVLSGYYGSTNGETVTFSDRGQSIGTGTLSSGTATLSLSTLPVGIQSITATYPGDFNNGNSTSNAFQYLVNYPNASPTTTTLAVTSGGSAVTTVASGTVVTLTATVMSGSTPVTPGQVAFCDASVSYCTDIHLLGLAQLTSSGTAVFRFRPGGGSHSYKAIFLGTQAGDRSSSNTSALTVTKPFASTTQIQQSYQGNSWNLTALVAGGLSAPSFTAPTGHVSFIDTSSGNSVVGAASLTGSAISTGVNYLYDAQDSTTNTAQTMTLADVNGDGIPDLILGDYGFVSVLLGNGDGTFKSSGPQLSPDPPLSTYFQPASTLVADFNGDGILDIAVTDNIPAGTTPGGSYMVIWLGKGDGTFTEKTTISLTTPFFNGSSIEIGDFNQDGIPDLVMTGVDGIYVMFGNGDGTFRIPTAPATTVQGDSLLVGDFNGDGIQDLLAWDGSGGTVLLGNGDGTFTAKSTFSYPSVGQPIIADLRGNGILDVASWSNATASIRIALGNGDGTFNEVSSFQPDVQPDEILTYGDFNGDGIVDLAVGFPGIYLGKGDGTFTNQSVNVPFPLTDAPYGVIAGDLNGDGVWDLVVQRNPAVSILLVRSGWTASATLTNYAPSLATHAVMAAYPGDGTYAGSVSGVTSITPATAILELPASGSVLFPGNTTFLWTSGSGVSQYKLYLGTGGQGSSDLYAGAPTTATSAVVPLATLPLNGATITATLYSYIGGTWTPVSTTYTEPQAPVITSPAPNSHLSGSTATFTWTPGSGVTKYVLYVGTDWPGGFNIYASGGTTSTSETVSGLPTNGVNVYITLQYEFNGVWYLNNYTYTAAGQTAPPVLTSPTPGTQLSGSSVNFQWTPGSGVTLYRLNISSYGPGYFDLYGSGTITTTSAAASNLPTDGRTLYATLFYRIDGVWNSTNYTYTATGSVVPPALTSPTPGSQLSGSSVTFTWTPGSGVYAYQISAGTYGPGYFNIGGSPTLTTTSYTLPGIPTNGKPVYVTFRYEIADGIWKTIEYTYTAAP